MPARSVAAAPLALLLAASLAGAAPELDRPGGGSLLEGLDGLLEAMPDDAPAPGAQPGGPPPLGDLSPDANPPLPPGGEDLGAAGDTPLAKIESGMDQARRLIEQAVASGKASGVQRQVVADLEALIDKAEEQCKRCNSAAGSRPSQPQPGDKQRQASQRSQPKAGQGQAGGQQPGGGVAGGKTSGSKQMQQQSQQSAGRPGRGQETKQSANNEGNRSVERRGASGDGGVAGSSRGEMMKEVWGRLPQRLRERMLESSTGEFLPEYKEDIEQYFRRLAEEPK